MILYDADMSTQYATEQASDRLVDTALFMAPSVSLRVVNISEELMNQLFPILPGLVIGVLVALASAFASHRFTRSRERERWNREDEVQRERWDHEDKVQKERWHREDELMRETWDREDRLRLFEERVKLYRDFLTEAQRLRKRTKVDVGRLAELEEEINLISSNEVYVAATAVQPALMNWQEFDKTSPNVDSHELGRRYKELIDSMYHFRNIAREYLGSIPETPANHTPLDFEEPK